MADIRPCDKHLLSVQVSTLIEAILFTDWPTNYISAQAHYALPFPCSKLKTFREPYLPLKVGTLNKPSNTYSDIHLSPDIQQLYYAY